MTESTYEINFEKLSSLSIADLTGIIVLYKTFDSENSPISKEAKKELSKRINDIIVF